MKSMKFIFKAVMVFFIFMNVQASLSQDKPQYIALITGKKGTVLIKKAGKAEFENVDWGTQLFTGDQIRTEKGSEVSITFSDGTIIGLGPGGSITISGETLSTKVASGNVRKVSSAMMADISALTSQKNPKKDVGALAGLRSVGIEQPFELTSPYNTLIRTNRPTFTWSPKKPYDNYIVNLYSSEGLVWSSKVNENYLKFPENEKGLEPGETYFWNVEGEDLLDNKKSPNYKFSVLSFEKSKEVLDQEKLIRQTFDNDADSASLHSFLGAYYMNQGLLEDAIREFEIISGMNPDSPLPHEILGSLYSNVGNKDKAIEELQRALALSKGKEK
jgi:hypothetical protein